MNPPLSKPTAVNLSASQRAALLTLLTDDDPAVYQTVRDKILTDGQPAREWLRPHTLSSDPVLRRRAQEIIQHLARQTADDRFLAFCLRHRGDEFDVEEAVWLLAQTQYPDTNLEAYQALLDSYAADLSDRIIAEAPPKQILTVLNHFFFEELDFRGDEKDYYDPDNSYLNRVMDRRMGNPISLCLVYLLVARRLRLPVAGIGLPGHFLCRFQNTGEEIYIDVFHRGRFLTKNDCLSHLVRNKQPLDTDLLSPASPHRILGRMCANLYQSYLRMELTEESARLQRYVIALAR